MTTYYARSFKDLRVYQKAWGASAHCPRRSATGPRSQRLGSHEEVETFSHVSHVPTCCAPGRRAVRGLRSATGPRSQRVDSRESIGKTGRLLACVSAAGGGPPALRGSPLD